MAKSPIAKLSKWVKQHVSIKQLEEDAMNQLENQLYGWITATEAKHGMKGFEKYITVANKLFSWAIANGYGKYIPKLIPLVQKAVEHIYGIKDTPEAVVEPQTEITSAAKTT